jgi:hypothetical protein
MWAKDLVGRTKQQGESVLLTSDLLEFGFWVTDHRLWTKCLKVVMQDTRVFASTARELLGRVVVDGQMCRREEYGDIVRSWGA